MSLLADVTEEVYCQFQEASQSHMHALNQVRSLVILHKEREKML